MVFSVQQGEHGPLVVYKLAVPRPAAAVPAVPATPQTSAPVPRLRSSITRVPEHPATRTLATVVPSRAPRSLGTVVMPASALPPPQINPIAVPPAVPAAAPLPTTALPRPPAPPAPPAVASAPTVASLQPRVLGSVTVSEIEALTAYQSLDPVSVGEVPSSYLSSNFVPSSEEVGQIVEHSQFGVMMINEDTGESLTLQEVSDAVAWRRDTAERLRQVPIAPRF